jgi:hypothetical protein
LLTFHANAQLSNKRCKWIILNENDKLGIINDELNTKLQPTTNHKQETRNKLVFSIDTLSLIPDSIQIISILPQKKDIKLSYSLRTNEITLESEHFSEIDSVLICYRVFPFLFNKTYYKRSQTLYDSGFYTLKNKENFTTPLLQGSQKREELFSYEGLSKSGSLTRGISFGNRQDVFVNSALNLQLDGKIAPDIHLTAVLTDQNVPFQPDGNTQQIQEFDRVFIKLAHKNVALSAGDVVLRNSPSQFLRYYKNVLGGLIETTYGVVIDSTKNIEEQNLPKNRASSKLGFAVAKGQFYSYQVPINEGVQGPYRLRGQGNERFIIIIANSEKVYVDGRLLMRGFNYDYVIDYNTAEITFTPRVIITQFTRVRVDFEYSTQNYSRTILTASHYQELGKLSLFGNFYREKDNPNNPILAQLDTTNRRLLSQIGDDLSLAVTESAVRVPDFQEDRVLYTQKDTMIGSTIQKIYVRAKRGDSPLFNVSFSEVGLGGGDYELGSAVANGREYQWAGQGRGSYSPVRQLPAPNQKQMSTLGASYQINKNEKIFVETAFSDHDNNLFSAQSTFPNQGWAVKVGYAGARTIGGVVSGERNAAHTDNGKKTTSPQPSPTERGDNSPSPKAGVVQNTPSPKERGQGVRSIFSYSLDYEYNNPFFRPIDRFRYVEFDRDWSANTAIPNSEHILNASIGLKKDENKFISFRHTRRNRGTQVNGFQQYIDAGFNYQRMFIRSNFFLMKNNQDSTKADWTRWTTDIFHKTKYLISGYVYTIDKNAVRQTANDSIFSTAMNFDEHKFYLKSGDSSKWQYGVDYSIRADNTPQSGELIKGFQANTLNINLKRQTTTQLFNFQITYRKFDNLLKNPTQGQLPEETIMNRLDWNFDIWKGAIKSEFTLVNGTGRELRREFVYLKVNPGTGTHTWRDDNNDGVQQLNEFYLAINPDEKNYVKFFTPTDQYLLAYTNNFSYRLNLNAPRNWLKAKGLKRIIGKLSSVTSWTINRKTTDSELLPRFAPFVSVADESKLLSDLSNLRATLFYDRTATKFGAEFSFLQNTNRQVLTNGFEARSQSEFQLNVRYNLATTWNVRLLLADEEKGNRSDFLENRNYAIKNQKLKPEISFQPSQNLRFSLAYFFQNKKNTLGELGEKATLNEFILESRIAKTTNRTISARVRYVNITYNGQSNSPLGYEMLEALQVGQNVQWSLNWQQRLSNGLQLIFQYEGRKSENSNIVHIGRMQVAALF